MTSTETDAPNPVQKCNSCKAEDDHPKFHVFVGQITIQMPEGTVSAIPNPGGIFHPHDEDQDGYLDYHFDCAAELGHENAATQIDGAQLLRGEDRRADLINRAATAAEGVTE